MTNSRTGPASFEGIIVDAVTSPNGSQIVRGACGHDCPDTCSWIVEVQNGTAGKLYGDPTHPFTRGTLCAKVNHYLERVYHPDRVLHPLKRAGRKGEGQFVRVTWDEALTDIAARWKAIVEESGAEAILPVQLGGRAGPDSAGLARHAAVRVDGVQRPRSQHLRRGRFRGPHVHDRNRDRNRSGGSRP